MNLTQEFISGNGDGSVVEAFKSEHGPGSGLDPAMILLDQIVPVLRCSQLGALP
jgi:hypothetical protein